MFRCPNVNSFRTNEFRKLAKPSLAKTSGESIAETASNLGVHVNMPHRLRQKAKLMDRGAARIEDLAELKTWGQRAGVDHGIFQQTLSGFSTASRPARSIRKAPKCIGHFQDVLGRVMRQKMTSCSLRLSGHHDLTSEQDVIFDRMARGILLHPEAKGIKFFRRRSRGEEVVKIATFVRRSNHWCHQRAK